MYAICLGQNANRYTTLDSLSVYSAIAVAVVNLFLLAYAQETPIPPDASTTSIVFRPGGQADENVYTTEATLAAATQALNGARRNIENGAQRNIRGENVGEADANACTLQRLETVHLSGQRWYGDWFAETSRELRSLRAPHATQATSQERAESGSGPTTRQVDVRPKMRPVRSIGGGPLRISSTYGTGRRGWCGRTWVQVGSPPANRNGT